MSNKRNRLLLKAGYTYYEDGGKRDLGPETRSRWRCSTHQGKKGCNARINMVGNQVIYDQLLYMMSKKGNVMLSYQGHSYHLKYTKNSRKTWRCSRHCSFRCRATITTVDNHIWPMFLRTSVGTRSIVYNGYKFYKKKGKNKYSERWRCSLHQHFNCKAMLFTTHDQLIAMKGEHSHAPPKTLASLSQAKLIN
ncbi:unnamed protein product [Arctia plantaginis]|uniref:FLYWCH-type domain-containing protein n=1 Tax=Arctia plantaginis TaxID=874455 RepID=A0A8S1AYF1_ARCPL|nr:unnamed protein product [Arctia plantaginis]